MKKSKKLISCNELKKAIKCGEKILFCKAKKILRIKSRIRRSANVVTLMPKKSQKKV